MLDLFKFISNPDYRDQIVAFTVERGLAILLGLGICIVGIAFILNGSKAGAIAEAVVTKGTSLVKGNE